MKKKSLILTLSLSLVLIAAAVLCIWLFNRTASDGTFVYTWDEDAGGYSVSADASSFGEELVIPASYDGSPVVAISRRGFEGCKGFKRVTVPSSVKKVGYEAFKDCVDLEEVIWPESGVESVGNSVFYGCDKLVKMSLPKGIKIVSNSLFYGCKALEEVVIPDGTLTVVDRAFARCLSLKRVVVPSSVLRIGDSAFYNCPALESIEFEEGSRLEDIGRQSFYGCSSLTEIEFPESLVEIGTSAFAYCSGLESVEFTGGRLERIGASAFIGCHALNKVDVADIANWCGVQFLGDDYSNPIYLGQRLFHNGELVLRLEIPQGVTTVSARAFKNATRIVSLTLPDTFSYERGSVGEDAFRYCYKLSEIHNFSKLQIPKEASELASLGYIGAYIKGSVRYYDGYLYPTNGIFPYGESGRVYSLEESEAKNYDEGTSIYTYGEENEFLFYNDPVAGHYLLEYIGDETRIALPDLDKPYGIFTGAFFGQSGVEQIIVPDCVNEIWHFAFYSCSDLQNIYIPASVTSFGERLFGKCDGLVIDLESGEHNVGWKPNWADPTDKEIIKVNYGQELSDLPWATELLGK